MGRQLQPQEIVAHYVLPAIRKELAVSMKASGSDQKTIAKKLCVTEAAVSQYINEKRASTITFPIILKEAIGESANEIKDNLSFTRETQKILKVAMKEGVTCKVCHEVAKTPASCRVCFE